ncbi:MAG: hypothetical protein H0Z24_03520 [Thermosipho sp. (in: Bacteria)]|nr:hypothetical protein [Thermosipho sp. (in: thermotogales)]
MLKTVKNFIKDERGAVTSVELIGYTLLIAGAVTLIGFGVTAMGRGKAGDMISDFKNLKAMDDLVDENSGYGYVAGTETTGRTGMVTDVQGQ